MKSINSLPVYNTKITKNNNASAPEEITNKKTDEIKDGEKKISKGLVALGIIAAANIAISTAVAIGKNPQKAAKILKGTSEYFDDAYRTANDTVTEMMAKKGKFSSDFQDMISEIQLRSKSKSGADDLFNEVSEYLKTQDNVPNDVSEAMGVLTQGLARTYDGFMETLKKGGSIPYDEISNCKLQNKKYIDIIRQYLRSGEINPTSKKLSEQLQMLNALGYMPRGIFDCPQDLLPSDKIYYHGTRHARKVYQNGFSPYVSNQLYRSPREFGAGIYTSPDIKVASGFSGKHGDIIPIKLNDDAKIAFVSAYSHQELFRKLYAILREEIGEEKFKNMPSKEKNALIEILTQKLFKESGYDAVYTPKGYRVGFNLFGGDINEQLGTPQSQVVIFSPEKTEITSRSFSERVGDLKAKKKTRKAMFEYQKNNLFAGLM